MSRAVVVAIDAELVALEARRARLLKARALVLEGAHAPGARPRAARPAGTPTDALILKALEDGPLRSSGIAAAVKLDQFVVLRRLTVLRQAGRLERRRAGPYTTYALTKKRAS